MMQFDKKQARKRKSRISERFLLGLGFIGGAFGILVGMYYFHHKTKKLKFIYGIPLLFIMHIFILFIVL